MSLLLVVVIHYHYFRKSGSGICGTLHFYS